MKIIEKPMIKSLLDKVFSVFEVDKATLRIIEEHILHDVAQVKVYRSVNSKRKRVAKAKIMGTTFSGHCVSTTLGNTLRVAAMICYIFHLCGYDDVIFGKNPFVVLFVAGDDVIVKCTKQAREAFESVFFMFYKKTTEEHATHGFGQVCKKLNLGGFGFIDFLSKEGKFY